VFGRLMGELDRIYPVMPGHGECCPTWSACAAPRPSSSGCSLSWRSSPTIASSAWPAPCRRRRVKDVLTTYVGRDEKMRAGLAAIYLPRVLRNLPPWHLQYPKAKQMNRGLCLERTTYAHRHDADAGGIDLYEALTRVLRPQERIIGEMHTRRAIWKNAMLKRMGLATFTRLRDRHASAPLPLRVRRLGRRFVEASPCTSNSKERAKIDTANSHLVSRSHWTSKLLPC
jgi:hypothetical protein